MDHLSSFTEGDYIRTVESLFFAVKGSVHPNDMVIAYLRYVPDPKGDRSLDGVRYSRVSDLDETTKYLEKKYPIYLNQIEQLNMTLQSVRRDRIASVSKPRERLRELIEHPVKPLERTLTQFVETIIDESGVPAGSFGVTGSLLIGLDHADSDLDLNVYGLGEGRRVYSALKRLRRPGGFISPYDDETVKGVLSSRWGDLGHVKALAEIEKRKVLHGMVQGTDYFVRLLRDLEVEYSSIPMGTVIIKAQVKDSSGSIFTPCRYRIGNVETLSEPIPQIIEIISHRGKFTEQAERGQWVRVRGNLEEVQGTDGTHFRVILGGEGDYMLPLSLDTF